LQLYIETVSKKLDTVSVSHHNSQQDTKTVSILKGLEVKVSTKEDSAPRTIGFRAPPDLAEWLRDQARVNSRTVSNQTVWALQQYRKQQDGEQPRGAQQ
jgi:hypothetical protein